MEDHIIESMENIVQDLLIPARTEKKVNKKAFEKFDLILDEIEAKYREATMINRGIVAYLFFIYTSLAAEAQYCTIKDELFIRVSLLETRMGNIFGSVL